MVLYGKIREPSTDFFEKFFWTPSSIPQIVKTFFEGTVGGKHCVGRQSDKRGAKKGGIPYKPRFHEQLFRLARVPWKSKKPALGGLLWDCVVVLAYYASAVMRACHQPYCSSDTPAHIEALPIVFSGSNLGPVPCTVTSSAIS